MPGPAIARLMHRTKVQEEEMRQLQSDIQKYLLERARDVEDENEDTSPVSTCRTHQNSPLEPLLATCGPHQNSTWEPAAEEEVKVPVGRPSLYRLSRFRASWELILIVVWCATIIMTPFFAAFILSRKVESGFIYGNCCFVLLDVIVKSCTLEGVMKPKSMTVKGNSFMVCRYPLEVLQY
ncbi:hypothetical protein HDU67_004083 [Dinochytrium kinnereticum]|nr:hypothetical protein HDU67_004083 [Dinochytrium kinnereticum]